MCLIKRAFDVINAGAGLVLLSPLLVMTALLVWITLGSPIFFRQTRPGRKGKPFEMIKFRTMSNIRGVDGDLLPDVERITRFGNVLRSSSLDELPELWNVVKGDMSLVGPRPLLMDYLPLYTAEQYRRHDVRPGITGWAQVHGRNSISWEEKFKLDVWYVDHQSLGLDLKILLMTLKKVFAREGVSAKGHITIEKFRGNG